jgi:hypothetical protein
MTIMNIGKQIYPFKHYLIVSLDCGHEIYKMKKTGCQRDYTGNIFYLKTAAHQPSTSEGMR